jgi:putative DNA primase/helicase
MNAIGPDYSMQSPPGLLVERRGESHPTELASLFGKRLVIASETEQTADLAEGLIKQLTGGDAISARRMREDFWTFQPSHKIILATNHRPKVKGTDHGIWRRLRLVPFTQTFEGQRKDASLKGRLLSIPAGILAWLVRGCLEWQREGLGSADEVDAATAGYKSEQDVIGRFVSDCCMQSAAYRIRFSALYAALEKWVGEIGDNLPTKKMFGEWLGANGFESKRSNGAWWIGTTTRPELDENSNVTFEHFQ